MRVVGKKVRVVEVASSCRIESRRDEGEGRRSQFFARAFVIKGKLWAGWEKVLDYNRARTCVSVCS